MILERVLPDWKTKVQSAVNFFDIATVIKTLFDLKPEQVPGQEPPKGPNDYKNENSDYGLKAKGIRTRERLNEQAREIIDRIKDPGDLTEKDREILKQYSGRGGLTENSQFEYYTPTHVAEGLWDGMVANGFQNGNVLDPCTGAGIFSATKPKGVVITGADIDPVGSRVAQMLNPGDLIKNQSFERTVLETPDDTFDAVVGNIPFGSARGASAHEDPDYKDEKRIERYFILRALDKVKPGGLCCLVVPINIVGAKGGQWEKFRIAASKKAEFLGAHKLPSKTFGAQGTDTVVDIVVFRKHSRDFLDRIETIPFDILKAANVVWNEFISGQYWIGEGRPYIMGKWVPKIEGERWSRETVDGDIDNASLKARLAQRFNSRIDWDILEAAEPIVRNYADGDHKIINGTEYEMQDGSWVKVIQTDMSLAIDATKYGMASLEELRGKLSSPKGALTLSARQVFAVFKSFPDLLSPLQKASIEFAMSQPKEEYQEQLFRGSVIGGMIARYQNAVNDGTAEDADRLELQELVSKEIDTYGHPKNNKGLMITGESSRMFGLFRNAVDEKGQFSDLLAGTIEGSGRSLEYDSTNIQAIVEHLFVREGIQAIEIEDVQKLYTGKRQINSLSDLTDDDALAITPDGMILPMGRYCVGDIYPKIQAMSDALATETDERIKDKYLKQIEAIMQRRKTTKPEDIVFGMRQKWYSRKYVVDFLRENGYPHVTYGRVEEVTEEDPFSGKPVTRNKFVEDFETPFGQFYGIDDKGGFPKQFLKYINGENVTSSCEDAQERIKEYKDRCANIEEQFNVWMQQHTEIGDIAEQYNRKFNAFTPFDYEDANLRLKDVSPQVKLHGYQNSAIRRMSEEGRGILAHNVGLGKTYSALGLYSYNRQLGRSQKTCIVVPKSVLGNWYHESKKFLGQHNGVLFVGFEPKTNKNGQIEQETVKDEKGNPKVNPHTGLLEYQDVIVERNGKEDTWEAMWKIPQANYSLVVMTKEKFGMIPMRPDSKKAYADKMVDRSLISEKMAAAAVAENSGSSGGEQKKVSYAEDVSKARLEQQFSDEGTVKKGELPYFEDMGFTDVIVDECFVYNTEVLTRKGSLKIGDICKNMIRTDVLSCDLETGALVWKPIIRWLPKKLHAPLIKVTLESGSYFICTENHRIWTAEDGYVEAGKLRGYHGLCSLQEPISSSQVEGKDTEILQQSMYQCSNDNYKNLRMVREGIQLQISREGERQEAVLQQKVLGTLEEQPAGAEGKICGMDQSHMGMLEGAKIPGIFGENEAEKPDDESREYSKNGGVIEGENLSVAGRELKTNGTTVALGREVEFADGISNSNETREGSIRVSPVMLQGGSGNPGQEDCNRGGRPNAYNKEVEISRQTEDGCSECVGVVCIEVLEPGDYVRCGLGSSEDQTVYDLEIADTHNYFANGVLVSNCHEFKNSMLGGEHYQDTAYLPTAPPAKRALDMSMKMNYIREANNGRGAYMLSATPVTNSPFEIFNMLSYVCPMEEFEAYGIYTPDDFIRIFGEITQVDKMTVDGGVKTRDGLTGFQNLDGLRTMFHKYVNMKSAEDFPDQIKLPPNEEVSLDVELTDEQQRVYADLRERAKEASKPPQKGEKKESMFSVIRDMDRVTTDMDLYYKTMTFVFRGEDREKAEALVKSLPKSIKIKRVLDSDELEEMGLDPEANKGRAQEIEVKLETTTRLENGNYIVVFPREYENFVVDRFPDQGIAEENVSHPLMPKYARLIENLRADLEADGKQLIFTEEKSQHQKILRLIVHHIPTIANLIGVINAEEASGERLQKISDSYNSGNLKFVICNKKAEVGVNLQKGTTAIHHLTLPWTPASIQQRNGRGVRQGNQAAMIHIYYYCGKGSFDAYRLEVLKAKSNWMRELFDGSNVTAENANAMNQDEMMDMLEADPEAAKRRRMERLAVKKAEDEGREKKRLANQLQILAKATEDLNGLDKEKEEERARLNRRIPELEEEIKRLQERGLQAEGDERARLGSQIISKQTTLKNSKQRLEGLDQSYDEKRVKLTSVVQQTSGLLKQKAKKGQLPFSESLIDNPANACVGLNGQVVAVGDCYEFKDEYSRGVIKITNVDPAKRAFQYENIVGGINRSLLDKPAGEFIWYLASSLEKLQGMGLKKVSYSEAEINLLKVLSSSHDYESLASGDIDKDTFINHCDEIKWKSRGTYLFRGDAGNVEFSIMGQDYRGNQIVFPEPNSETFRKAACEAYLVTKRGDGYASYEIQTIMKRLFGAQWESVAMEYGRKASEKHILEVCAKAWDMFVKKEYGGDMGSLLDLLAKERYTDFAISDITSRPHANALEESQKLGDNEEEIKDFVSNYFAGTREKLAADVSARKAELEREAQDALKSDPNFKEIPQEVREAFAKLGISVKTNQTRMALPGFKGRRGAVLEPFARWFFQDRSGKSGVLFKTKDILKARYGAQFFSDAGEAFEGAWWHVPSSTDLKAIYELLA